jgi:hypothetical protein
MVMQQPCPNHSLGCQFGSRNHQELERHVMLCHYGALHGLLQASSRRRGRL